MLSVEARLRRSTTQRAALMGFRGMQAVVDSETVREYAYAYGAVFPAERSARLAPPAEACRPGVPRALRGPARRHAVPTSWACVACVRPAPPRTPAGAAPAREHCGSWPSPPTAPSSTRPEPGSGTTIHEASFANPGPRGIEHVQESLFVRGLSLALEGNRWGPARSPAGGWICNLDAD